MPDYVALVWFVTDFGDAAILLPISVAVFLCLLGSGAYRVAGAWAVTIALCLASMIVLKLVFRTCGSVWTQDAVISPSGHTAFSTAVYGGLAGLLAIRTGRLWLRILIPLVTAGWLVAIGVSRVLLNAHTPEEVLIGWGVGAIWVGLLCLLTWRTPLGRGSLVAIGSLVVMLLFLLHGDHTAIESFFIRMASLIHQNFSVCT